ncbi:hypothetical protein GGX14DRAFT_572961 [Mycena pura]|uniref:Glycan binding protein Y3-like domain-containing protein n=1 Tax=Mycena pura TaxID=153505 RepID=A0AAD6V0M0_9AGAR|nr:hypothetical protein GGX14DRAFT_572961 [Mycena pura]
MARTMRKACAHEWHLKDFMSKVERVRCWTRRGKFRVQPGEEARRADCSTTSKLRICGISLHLAALALLFAPTFGQFNVTCIPSGTTGNCGTFTTQFCSSFDQHIIQVGNSISACFATGVTNLKCDLTVVNTDGVVTGPPSVGNCETILSTVAAECPMDILAVWMFWRPAAGTGKTLADTDTSFAESSSTSVASAPV